MDFIVSLSQNICFQETLLDYTSLFSPNYYKKNDKIIYNILKINMAEEASLEFGLRKIDETRNYLLDEIKQWFSEWKI